jgi:hypothetical protein
VSRDFDRVRFVKFFHESSRMTRLINGLCWMTCENSRVMLCLELRSVN